MSNRADGNPNKYFPHRLMLVLLIKVEYRYQSGNPNAAMIKIVVLSKTIEILSAFIVYILADRYFRISDIGFPRRAA